MTKPDAEEPALWSATEMRAQPHRWLYHLSDEQLSELRAATAQSMADAIPVPAIERANFHLPILGGLLDALRVEIVNGQGFALLRGLPVADMSREEVIRAYFGIGAWFGTAVSQNAKSHLVGHVKDLGHDPTDPKTRIYTTRSRQPFHVDSVDIVSLLCLQPAKRGGASSICSSIAIMRAIERERPDLLRLLEQPWIYDRKGEVPEGKHETYEIPILHRHAGLTTVFYARDFIESAQQRFPDLPRLTATQIEALDLVDVLANDPHYCLDMDFQAGDIQVLHNHQVLHARTAYEDYPEPERKRHLLRLWLSAHEGRQLPPIFAERYGPMLPGQARGGIIVKGAIPATPFDAE